MRMQIIFSFDWCSFTRNREERKWASVDLEDGNNSRVFFPSNKVKENYLSSSHFFSPNNSLIPNWSLLYYNFFFTSIFLICIFSICMLHSPRGWKNEIGKIFFLRFRLQLSSEPELQTEIAVQGMSKCLFSGFSILRWCCDFREHSKQTAGERCSKKTNKDVSVFKS